LILREITRIPGEEREAVGEEWISEGEHVERLFRLSRLVRPRLVFRGKRRFWDFNAWCRFRTVYVGAGLRNAPGFVRPYVLGHEYAHIYRGHTLLAPMMALSWLVAAILSVFSRRSAVCWVLNFMFFVVAFLASFMFLFLWGTGLGEYTADTMGAKACGDPELALKAALWMAEKNGAIKQKSRRKRLFKMGWDGKDSWHEMG
jgi:Peptidase family M48